MNVWENPVNAGDLHAAGTGAPAPVYVVTLQIVGWFHFTADWDLAHNCGFHELPILLLEFLFVNSCLRAYTHPAVGQYCHLLSGQH